ncbi:MAG: N-acetylmuramoyl-L-alanine amidase [Thermoleophilaceae bacterium]
MKRLVLLALAAVIATLGVLAAPALSTRQWVPDAVDFELAPDAGNAAAAGAVRGRGLVAPALRTPKRFNLVGFRWSGRGEPSIAIRTRTDGGRWTRWSTLHGAHDHGPDPGAERSPPGATDPVWVGGADWIQYRMSAPVRGLRLHFVNSTGTATAAARAKTALRGAASRGAVALAGLFSARAQDAQPGMVARADWGADSCPPRSGPDYGEVRAALVHHTVSTNTYTREEAPSVVLGICRYHRNSNGWSDIGYNFLVDQYGTIYEGRAGGIDRPVIGAQAQGFNAQTTGIASIGRHDTVASAAPPTGATIDAVSRLIRWKLPVHGQPTAGTVLLTSAGGSANRHPRGAEVEFERISGHRDAGRTACPGEQLYDQLPTIRARVGGVEPRAARTRISARIGPRVVRFPQAVRFSGRLTLGSGGPVGDAPVQVQALRGQAWRTVKAANTGSDGSFATEINPGGSNTLRVRYPGGASLRPVVSRRTLVRVRPRVTAGRSVSRARVGQTPIVAGRIQPRRAKLELVVQRRVGRRNVTISKTALRARGGRFRKGVRVKRAGLYRFYVRFRADSKNLGATSTPFYIRVVPAGSGGGAAAE